MKHTNKTNPPLHKTQWMILGIILVITFIYAGYIVLVPKPHRGMDGLTCLSYFSNVRTTNLMTGFSYTDMFAYCSRWLTVRYGPIISHLYLIFGAIGILLLVINRIGDGAKDKREKYMYDMIQLYGVLTLLIAFLLPIVLAISAILYESLAQ